MNTLLIAVALLSFVIYGIAIKRLFSSSHGVDRRMQVLKVCGALFALVHLWAIWEYQATVGYLSLMAFGTYLAGLGVFFAARQALAGFRLTLAFSPDTPERILDQGIYARVRHPFYLAYSLTWLGGVLAAPSVWTLSTTGIMFFVYWQAARQEEHKFLLSPLAETYKNYKSETGMFFPSRGLIGRSTT